MSGWKALEVESKTLATIFNYPIASSKYALQNNAYELRPDNASDEDHFRIACYLFNTLSLWKYTVSQSQWQYYAKWRTAKLHALCNRIG